MRYLRASALALWTLAFIASPGRPAQAFDGAELYAVKCVECHGTAGQGSDYHSVPLAGDLPVSELARVITETMPEGDAESVVGAEAEAIARHVHQAFYSPLAQARNRPPRRELSRLTVRQYEQSLADLIGAFRWRREWGDRRGLKVVYASRRRFDAQEVHADRVEPVLDVSVAASSFLPESVRAAPTDDSVTDPKESSERIDALLNVSGGVWAPKTGDYEFVVRSPNGFSLDLNGEKIINGQIRSSGDDELSARVRLIGGRVYPLSLDARRTREADLRVTLLWKPPGGVLEVIPERFLAPTPFPEVHATQARFPPDDRSVGYVRGASISAAWDEATTAAALGAAGLVVDDLAEIADLGKDGEPISRQDAIAFNARFAEMAFRRPLSENEHQRYVDRFFDDDGEDSAGVEQAIELSLLAILKSPLFLYPEVALHDAPVDRRDDYAVAIRLALGLWDSLPDEALRRKAEKGRLANSKVAAAEARRMLADPRTRAKVAEFFEHWLRLDHAGRLSRDPDAFPDFNDRVAADMRTSLDMLLDDVVWTGDGDLRELFLTEQLYVNERLAEFLGLEAPSDAGFVTAEVETRERAGVVSHPYLVTAFSYYRDTSPIHRGVFLARNVLGRSLRPPPEAVAPLAPELAPEMTTRERVAAQTSPGACQACHVLINDLGFTLEHFDAVGRYRETELDRPIDARGGYIATDGGTVWLQGARDLARFLADSEDVHRSFVTQLFEHVTKQPILAYGLGTRERLLADFRAGGFNIRELLCDIAATAALAN